MVRGFRPSLGMVLAVVAGLIVLLVGLDLGLGVFLTLMLAVVAAALVGAYFSTRRQQAPRAQRPGRAPTPPRPQLRAGHEVITVRDLGGALSEHVPAGTRGVITAAGWDGLHASFTIYGAMGTRQARCRVRPDDVRRV